MMPISIDPRAMRDAAYAMRYDDTLAPAVCEARIAGMVVDSARQGIAADAQEAARGRIDHTGAASVRDAARLSRYA